MMSGHFRRFRSLVRILALPVFAVCLAGSVPCSAHAQGTRLWTESSFEDLERGTPNGVAVTSDGHLVPGPQSTAVLTTPSTYVWAVATDRDGNAYLATGTPATVLRVSPDGKSRTLFTSHDMSMQTVRVGPDGSIYAATLPSGKVYKLDAHAENKTEENATLVFDPAATTEKPKYVWDLAFDAKGQLYIATGAPAAVYRVGGGGKPSLFFKSDEEHIRALAFDKAGNLIAGSDGTGLIYRIDPEGMPYVLYDSPKKEITSVAVAPDGSIYAAGVGEKGRNTQLPPLAVTGQATVTATITIVAPGSVQAFNGNTLIPEGSDLYEIAKGDGPPQKIWSGKDDIVYALAWTPDGVLAATGNRGRIYRVHDDGTFADIAHLEATQVTGFADSAKGLYVATANSGKLFLLTHGEAPEGSYTSEVFDAGVFAQWGRAEVETGVAASGFEMLARAGNIDNPERAWGEWKKFAPNAGAVGIATSRFMQWKLVEHPGSTVGAVAIDYLPVNVAPEVDEIVVAPGTRATNTQQQSGQPQQVTINFPSQQNTGITFAQPEAGKEPLPAVKEHTAVTVRWAAHDENGDDLVFTIFYRGQGDRNWQLLKDHVRERFYSFDSALLPDGHYRIEIVASDAPSHNPGEALSSNRISDDFLIDTTPPVVTGLEARLDGEKIHASLTAIDATSPVSHAEYSIDAGRWQYVEPVGKIADSLTEHFDFEAPLPAVRSGAESPVDSHEHVIAIRVFDREDNSVTVKAVVR
jgi:WD40 repeat protein